MTSVIALVVVAAVTLESGVREAVLQERKYSSMKCVNVEIIVGETGMGDLAMAARTCSLAAANSGVILE